MTYSGANDDLDSATRAPRRCSRSRFGEMVWCAELVVLMKSIWGDGLVRRIGGGM